MFAAKDVFSFCFLFGTLLVSGRVVLFLTKFLKAMPNRNFLLALGLMLFFHGFYVFVVCFAWPDYLFLNTGAPFALIYGPAIFGMTKLVEKQSVDFKKWVRHFVPFWIFAVGFVTILILEPSNTVVFRYFNNTLYIFAGIHLGGYLFFSRKTLRHYFQSRKAKEIIKRFFDYLFILGGLSAFLFFMVILDKILPQNFNASGNQSYVIHFIMLCVACLFHWSIFSYWKNGILEKSEQNIWPLQEGDQASALRSQKYSTTLKEEDYLESVKTKIENLPEEVFFDRKLTVKSLSFLINEQAYVISQVFSVKMQTNFAQFVNHKRLLKAEKLLVDPSLQNRTIADIAYLSGFKSESSFYRVFKNRYNCSPRQFKEKNKNSTIIG